MMVLGHFQAGGKRRLVILQQVTGGNGRTAAVLDILEAMSGFSLALFLWMHMIFVATIYFGADSFDAIAHTLDVTRLSYAGIPPLIIVFFLHFLLAARKIPPAYRQQRVLWAHAATLDHKDTWSWLVQVVTGMAILVLASIHFWVVLSSWPIESSMSAYRISRLPYFLFYLVLLVLGELHAGLGLYRLAVKWGWPRREKAELLFEFISAAVILAGIGALFVFRRLG
jgi:fumarate reductase subunit C